MTFAAEVNVFSARHYDSDVQLYEKFTAKTGIKVNIVSGKDKALQKRIIEEGSDSKADLYITADAGRLGAFATKGMFQNTSSAAIKAAVPSNFRTSKWTGIAKRARIGSITTSSTTFDFIWFFSGTSIGYALVISVLGSTRILPIFPKTIMSKTPDNNAAAILLILKASIN